ncbi:MAG: BMP family ABC transporter substrate-binding protein [Micropruina glycogenica]
MSDFKACMVSDAGGFDDKSFNETAYKGLTTTPSRSWALKAQVRSSVAADYAKNVQQMVDQKCNIIVTVGFAWPGATGAAAKQNRHRFRDRGLGLDGLEDRQEHR